jgi:hypothetical protein
MRRRIWILVVGLLFLLPVADAVLWHFAVGRLEAGFDAWVVRAKAAGWSVGRGRSVSGGWPWAATLEIRDVAIAGGMSLAPGGVAWRVPNLTLRIPMLRPRSMDIEVFGEQRLRFGDMPEVALTGSRLLAVLGLAADTESRALEVLADRPHVVSSAGWALSAAQASFRVQLPPAIRTGDTQSAFSFNTEAVVLPAAIRWPLGGAIRQLSFDGTLEGPMPPAQSPAPWATAWRDGGGSLQIQNMSLIWGSLTLAGAATLALDDQLQPMGAGTSKVTGYAATLDALATSGALSRSAATAAKAVLSLLAGGGDDGDPADVDVPLTLQYRTLSMRQVPLLRLPEMDWPGQ